MTESDATPDQPHRPNDRKSPGRTLAGVRILHVTLDGPTNNPRMLKENRSYIGAGAKVFSLIVGERRDDDLREDVDGATLLAYRLPRLRAIRAKIASQTLFRSRDFRRHIDRAVTEIEPDVIQAHDMFVAGSVLASRTDIPVILDLHENYPAATEQYRTAYPRLKQLLFGSFQHRRRMDRVEARYISHSELVLTVTEEASARVAEKSPTAAVVTVPNVEVRDFGAQLGEPSAPQASTPMHPRIDELRLVYTGGFEVLRGLHTVVRAIALLNRDDVHLDLIGARDSDYVRWLRCEVDELGVRQQVTLFDWVPREEVAARIDSADLTLVPHEANDQTNATLPHKLFQYMARSKPVLVSSCPPLAKHVQAADSGFVFNAGDEHDCARAIQAAVDSRADLARLGENGRHYVTETMNWELVSGPALIRAVSELMATGPMRPDESTSSLGS